MSDSDKSGLLGERIAAGMATITLEKVADIGLKNAQLNAPLIASGKSIEDLATGSLANASDALIIAAGPSLHRNNPAPVMRDSGFSGTIIATESAMSWCLRNGIVPSLVVTLDPHPGRIVRWFGDPALNGGTLAADDYFSRQDMDPKFRQDQLRFNAELLALIDRHASQIRVAVASCASRAVVDRVMRAGMDVYWWNPIYDDYDHPSSLTRRIHAMNGLPCLNAGGNVGSACWVFAHAVLGKTRVGLVGMDLGYYADTPYAQTQYYREIVDLVGEDRLDEVFVRVTNPNLDQDFYTDPAYLWYRNGFLEMAQAADCETYNCSGGGILFGEGIKWASLEDFVELNTARRASEDG